MDLTKIWVLFLILDKGRLYHPSERSQRRSWLRNAPHLKNKDNAGVVIRTNQQRSEGRDRLLLRCSVSKSYKTEYRKRAAFQLNCFYKVIHPFSHVLFLPIHKKKSIYDFSLMHLRIRSPRVIENKRSLLIKLFYK